jgi:aminoglycoside 3-N-acetyltransferase I
MVAVVFQTYVDILALWMEMARRYAICSNLIEYFYMHYVYKRLTKHDVGLLRELRQVFAIAFEEEANWKAPEPHESYLANVLDNENYIALVALTEAGRVVGGLAGHILHKIDQEQSEIYLYDLAVAESYRRHGIATQLIEELKRIGKAVGAYVIFVQADNEDTGAVALYTKISDSVETDISHFDIRVQ